MGQPGERAVIESEYRYLLRHRDSRTDEDIHDTEGTTIVEREHRGGQLGFGQHGSGGRSTLTFGEPAGTHLRRDTGGTGGPSVTPQPFGRARSSATVEIDDPAVAELDQMIGPEQGTGRIVAAHNVDTADLAGEHHHRHPGSQVVEPARRRLRTDEQQPLTLLIDQCAQRTGLVAVRGDTAEHHVIAEPLGRDVDTIDEVGVKLLADGEGDPDELGAQLAQPARPMIGPVPQLVGRAAHPVPGLLAGPRRIAHDDRDERAGDSGARGHIRKRGASLHDSNSRTF